MIAVDFLACAFVVEGVAVVSCRKMVDSGADYDREPSDSWHTARGRRIGVVASHYTAFERTIAACMPFDLFDRDNPDRLEMEGSCESTRSSEDIGIVKTVCPRHHL